jgi:hypothetical protein
LKLSGGQVRAAAIWWTQRIRLGAIWPSELVEVFPNTGELREDATRRIEAAAPRPEQLPVFQVALERRLAEANPSRVDTIAVRHVEVLRAAADEAGISWDRFQPYISMLFLAGGVQVRDGFRAELMDIYVEPLTVDIALSVLEANDAVAEDEGTGDRRGRFALAFLRERLKEPRWRVGDERHVELWAAIDELIGACGGNRQAKSVQRMTCVARVERALTALAGEPNPMRTDR